MAFKVEITEAAKQDIEEAINYYNSKSNGVSEKFYNQFKGSIEKIKVRPLYYSY